jgi:hypothetical protein
LEVAQSNADRATVAEFELEKSDDEARVASV